MRDEEKTKEQLINELVDLRQQIADFKETAAMCESCEKSLMDAEERFRSIFENTIVGIYQSSPEGRYITANPAFAHVLGFDSPGELLSTVTNIEKQLYVSTNDRAKCIEHVLENGVGDFEVQVWRKDGSKAWMANYVRVVRDDSGNIACFEGMVVDITKRKNAEEELNKYRNHLEEMVDRRTVQLQTALEQLQQEISERKRVDEALRESEERYRAIFENSPVGIIEAFMDGTILDANPAVCSLFGYTKDELRAVGRKGIVDINDPKLKTAIEECELTGKCSREILHFRKDGTSFEAEVTSNRFKTKNGNIKTIVIISDVTNRKVEEERLRQSEERFYKAFKSNPNLIGISTITDARYIDVNDSFLKVLGYQREEIIGRAVKELGIWSSFEVREKLIKKILAGSAVRNEEIHFHTKSGELIVGLASIEIIVLNNEQHLLVTVKDITVRKRLEVALKVSEERYRAIFEYSPDAVFHTIPDGTILDANYAACQMFGYSKEELCAVGRQGLLDINDPRLKAGLEERQKAGKVFTQVTSVRRDGTKFESELTSNIYKSKDSNVRSIVILRDITGRKQEEERLRQSEERFFKVFDASPAAMSIQLLSDYTLIDVNKNFSEITGYTRDEAIGKTPTGLGLVVNMEDISKILKAKESGAVKNVKVTLCSKTGEELSVLFSAVLININNKPCMLCMAHNITELMRFQDEMARLDRLNLVGEMAAGIGHEVRNPMTTVRGFLQIFREKKEFCNYTEQLDLMVEELDRANSIITEFLSLAKNKSIDLKRSSLNNIVKTLYPLMQADAVKSDKNINLELEDIPMILLDGKEIRQVILNLVRNGLEAMPPGGNLTIRVFEEKGEVILSVRDQGAGIKPEVLEKLGTPFFTTKETGTGLGLAVCYSIAARHNAVISIDTGPKGTAFNVIFNL